MHSAQKASFENHRLSKQMSVEETLSDLLQNLNFGSSASFIPENFDPEFLSLMTAMSEAADEEEILADLASLYSDVSSFVATAESAEAAVAV